MSNRFARSSTRWPLVPFAISLLSVNAVNAQNSNRDRPWWAGLDMGYGHVSLSSDQSSGHDQGTFAFSLHGGRKIGRHARFGFELGGWLLEGYDLYDYTAGRSISHIGPFVDLFPSDRVPIFLRAGAGWTRYSTNHLLDSPSGGWGWSAGLGYELSVGSSMTVTPRVGYSSGDLGEVRGHFGVETGRSYSAWECSAALSWHFGRPSAKNR